jgi:hypothetical protein
MNLTIILLNILLVGYFSNVSSEINSTITDKYYPLSKECENYSHYSSSKNMFWVGFSNSELIESFIKQNGCDKLIENISRMYNNDLLNLNNDPKFNETITLKYPEYKCNTVLKDMSNHLLYLQIKDNIIINEEMCDYLFTQCIIFKDFLQIINETDFIPDGGLTDIPTDVPSNIDILIEILFFTAFGLAVSSILCYYCLIKNKDNSNFNLLCDNI